MTFKEKLVILRKAKGLTQDEFASAVGVSRQAVYKWECGQSYPEVPKLLEMKLLFTISIDDLLDDSYDIPLPEKKKRKRISKDTMRDIEKSVEEEVSKPAVEKNPSPAPKAEPAVATVKAEPTVKEAPIVIKEIPAAPVEKEKAEAPVTEEKIFIPVIKEVEKETTVKIPTIQEVEATPLVDDTPADEESVVITPVITEEEDEPKKVGLFGRLFGRK